MRMVDSNDGTQDKVCRVCINESVWTWRFELAPFSEPYGGITLLVSSSPQPPLGCPGRMYAGIVNGDARDVAPARLCVLHAGLAWRDRNSVIVA